MNLKINSLISAFLFFGMAALANPKKCISPLDSTSIHNFKFDQDLFYTYFEEVKEITSNLSKNLDHKQQASEISRALQQRNKDEVAAFLKSRSNIDITQNSGRINLQKAIQIFNSIFTHPVVGEKASLKYEKYSQELGLCFGRAAYVHFELLKAGVSHKNIVKIFAMGGLYRENVGWDYHVATAVQSDLGIWLVIDSLNNEVTDVPNWVKKVSQWDGNKVNPRLRYYFTDANKFQPNEGFYSLERLNHPLYRGYFKDLLKWYSDKKNCINSP